MTGIYLICDDKMLLLYRQGSKVVNNLWVASAGGHFEEDELNNPLKCVLRELKEELSVTEDMLKNMSFRYIMVKKTGDEIRQNYYFFANLKEEVKENLSSEEGTLKWFSFDEVFNLEMPISAKHMMNHYLTVGKDNDKLYVGAVNEDKVVFTEM